MLSQQRHSYSRRSFLGMTGVGMAGLVLASACGAETSDSNIPGVSSKTPSGGAWSEPPVLASKGGVLEATLTLAPEMVPYGNGKRWALTVNGTSPGPTLRLQPGDRLRLVLDNRTAHPTNLHTHGLRVSPSGNADNPFLEIPAGKSFVYEMSIPKDHPGGLYWYHPHLHHHVAEQLFAGFFGAIVVEDGFDATPGMASATERIVLLHDALPGSNESSVTSVSMMEQMSGREGSIVLVNGLPDPNLTSQAGSMERWRVLNASASRFLKLNLQGHAFNLIGSDGGRLSASRPIDTLSLVPGERAEVLIQPTQPGVYTLGTAAVNRGSVGMGMGGGRQTSSGAAEVLRLTVTGPAAASAHIPALTGAYEDLSQVAPDRTRNVVLAMSGMGGMGGGMSFLIDGRQFDPERVDIRARLGTVEEWTVRNTSSMDHPFHLHVWPFQVMAQGQGTAATGWKDVVNVPAGSSVRIRMRFADISGRTVYHCHILDHEDLGMMGVIEVT